MILNLIQDQDCKGSSKGKVLGHESHDTICSRETGKLYYQRSGSHCSHFHTVTKVVCAVRSCFYLVCRSTQSHLRMWRLAATGLGCMGKAVYVYAKGKGTANDVASKEQYRQPQKPNAYEASCY